MCKHPDDVKAVNQPPKIHMDILKCSIFLLNIYNMILEMNKPCKIHVLWPRCFIVLLYTYTFLQINKRTKFHMFPCLYFKTTLSPEGFEH